MTLLDLIVLVAASAAALAAREWFLPGIAWLNPSWCVRPIRRVGPIRGTVAILSETSILAMPATIPFAFGLLALGGRRLRPGRRRRLWSQPGAIACLAVAVVYPLAVAFLAAGEWTAGRPLGYPLWRSVRLDRPAAMAGLAVLVAWATPGLAGRWRPERSWLDRAGRLVGLAVAAGAAGSAVEILFG